MLHGKWWEIYSDPELNALEDQLNINNQNIKQSFENFMEARTHRHPGPRALYPLCRLLLLSAVPILRKPEK